jgi:hypothetical protein
MATLLRVQTLAALPAAVLFNVALVCDNGTLSTGRVQPMTVSMAVSDIMKGGEALRSKAFQPLFMIEWE